VTEGTLFFGGDFFHPISSKLAAVLVAMAGKAAIKFSFEFPFSFLAARLSLFMALVAGDRDVPAAQRKPSFIMKGDRLGCL